MAVDAELVGMEELLDNIRRLGDRVSDTVEAKALKAGGEVLRSAIRARAPRSQTPRGPTTSKQSWRTGKHAADQLKISGIKTIDGVKSVLVGVGKGNTSHYFYLKFHEWGSSKQAARPFMAPAKSASKSAVADAMKDVIRQALLND